MLFDAHTHLPYNNADVTAIISVDANLPLPPLQNECCYSVGLHPQSLQNNIYLCKENICRLVQHSSVVAIGECGFDSRFPNPLQEPVFRLQAMLAEEMHLPVVIHCVRSFDTLIHVRKELRPSVPWVIHGYNKSPELALQLVRAGFLLSIGKAVLQQIQVKKVIDVLPVSSFLIETDNTICSSSEAYEQLERTYMECAFIKNISLVEMTEIMTTLFSTVFQKVRL